MLRVVRYNTFACHLYPMLGEAGRTIEAKPCQPSTAPMKEMLVPHHPPSHHSAVTAEQLLQVHRRGLHLPRSGDSHSRQSIILTSSASGNQAERELQPWTGSRGAKSMCAVWMLGVGVKTGVAPTFYTC